METNYLLKNIFTEQGWTMHMIFHSGPEMHINIDDQGSLRGFSLWILWAKLTMLWQKQLWTTKYPVNYAWLLIHDFLKQHIYSVYC